MKANFKREVKRNKNKHKIRRERGKTGPFCPGWQIHPGLKVGRGLGIFPARQKTPFVPGESTTRDKSPFCPGWWLNPGQKAPHITSSFALPLTLGFSSICAWCRRRPLLPPPREPSTAAAIDVAAAQSPDLTPPPRAPTNPPETRRNTAATVTPSPAPPSPARRRPAATFSKISMCQRTSKCFEPILFQNWTNMSMPTFIRRCLPFFSRNL